MSETKFYNTKEEAEEILKSKKRKEVFCPLIKDICRIDCVCFVEAAIVTDKIHGNIRYVVYDPYCGNTMFFGDCCD